MDFFKVLIGAIIFIYVLLFGLDKIMSKFHKFKKPLFGSLPLLILTVTLIYALVCYIKLINFLTLNELNLDTLQKLLVNDDTYTAIVNFFALLTFYQLLIDRYNKIFAKQFIKLSSLDVITRDVYNQTIKEKDRQHAKEIKMLNKKITDLNSKINHKK